MIEEIRSIKMNAETIITTTSVNSPNMVLLRSIVDWCDEVLEHFVDDGR